MLSLISTQAAAGIVLTQSVVKLIKINIEGKYTCLWRSLN